MSEDCHVTSAARTGAAHSDSCEAEADHADSCATATRLARLEAFAEAVRDEIDCDNEDDSSAPGHVDDCFHCYAEQALEPVR